MQVERSELEVLVPQANQLSLAESTALSSIPLRSSLHFGRSFPTQAFAPGFLFMVSA